MIILPGIEKKHHLLDNSSVDSGKNSGALCGKEHVIPALKKLRFLNVLKFMFHTFSNCIGLSIDIYINIIAYSWKCKEIHGPNHDGKYSVMHDRHGFNQTIHKLKYMLPEMIYWNTSSDTLLYLLPSPVLVSEIMGGIAICSVATWGNLVDGFSRSSHFILKSSLFQSILVNAFQLYGMDFRNDIWYEFWNSTSDPFILKLYFALLTACASFLKTLVG